MKSKPSVILLVEDDVRLANLTIEYLESEGFVVEWEKRGDRAEDRIMALLPDLIILDLMLPGRNGLEICKSVRPRFSTPILMLTARDEDVDEIVGLEIGADDYITKPVKPRTLLARIRALLRRTTGNPIEKDTSRKTEAQQLTFGELVINVNARQVMIAGNEIPLTTNEYDLFLLLVEHAGKVISRDKVLLMMRGIGYDGLDRSVDINISRLRKKLGDNTSKPSRIKTVRSKGYLFVAEAWAER